MIKRETIQDIVIDMKNFKAFISEAEDFAPERTKPIQSSLPGLGRKSIEKKYQVTNKPNVPARYSQVDPKQALMNYATELETRGVAGGRRKPEQVKLSPEEIKKRTAQVRDTFAAADKGDAAAVERLKKYQSGYDKKYGTSNVPEVEQSKPNRYIRGQQDAGIKVDPDLVDARGVAQSGKPEMVGQRAPSGQGAKYRAAVDAKSAGVVDAGTSTPRPGVRSDTLGDAIRTVPDEPQLPKIKVTGGQPRPTDLGTTANPLSQTQLRDRVLKSLKSKEVKLPPVPAKAPTGGPSLGSPTASGITPQRAANIAAARSATTQGAAATAQGMTTASRFMQAARLAGRGAQVAAAGMDYYAGSRDAKSRGAGTARQIGRGVTRALGGIVGGTVGAGTGAFLGTAGGVFTGPGALVTGTAAAFTGGAAGSQLGSRVADQAFQTVAGATDAEKKLMRQRKRQSQINMYGQGPKTQARTGNTAIVTGKDGKQRVGYLSYKDGKPVYTAPNAPSTLRYTSSNPIERIGRSLPFLQGYYANKDERNRQNDIAKQWRKFDQASKGRI